MELTRPDGSPLRVLVVDDEVNIAELISMALRYEGWEVTTAHTGTKAVAAAKDFRPDAVVLDMMLPDFDGLEVLRRMRATDPDVPVVFLTARDSVEDRVAGLTAGGDDYVTKPFSLEEVVARLRGLMRRSGARQESSSSVLTVGDLTLDEDSHEVRRDGDEISLTATEFELLRFLMRNPRRVLSKAQILDRVWNYDFGGQANVVELYVSYLRKKIDAGREPMIHTMRGAGYVLKPAPDAPTGRVPVALASLTSRLVVTAVALVAVLVAARSAPRRRSRCALPDGPLDHDVRRPRSRAVPGDRRPRRRPRGRRRPAGFDRRNQGARHAERVPRHQRRRRAHRDGPGESPAADARRARRPRDVPADGRVTRSPCRASAPTASRRSTARAGSASSSSGCRPPRSTDTRVADLAGRCCSTLLGRAAAAGVGLRRRTPPAAAAARGRRRPRTPSPSLPLASGEIELAERVPERLTDERTEVGQVGAALNTLLAHVESSLAERHRSEQQVRQFVADASHELRTPLATIAGYTELARRRPDDAATAPDRAGQGGGGVRPDDHAGRGPAAARPPRLRPAAGPRARST